MKLKVQIIGKLEGKLLKRALRDGKNAKKQFGTPTGKLCMKCIHSKHCGEVEDTVTCEVYKADPTKMNKWKRR